MAGEYSVVIGETTILDNATFQIGMKAEPNNNNQVESVLYSLTVEGDIVDDSPSDVADGFVALSGMVSDQATPVRVQVQLDGSAVYDWKPEDGFVGPFVVSFASVDDPGNFQSHARYRLEVLFRSKKIDEDQNQAYDIVATLSIAKDHDIVIRKVWNVAASAKSLTAARAFVNKFKPPGEDFQEEQKDDPINARSQSVWVWEALQEVHCQVTFEGGGREYVAEEQAGEEKPPVLFLKTQSPKYIRVRGYVRGYNPALRLPAKHFQESATLKEIGSHRRHRIQIEDAKRGIYVLPFEEDWICVDAVDPDPDHERGHHIISLEASPVPSNGKIETL